MSKKCKMFNWFEPEFQHPPPPPPPKKEEKRNKQKLEIYEKNQQGVCLYPITPRISNSNSGASLFKGEGTGSLESTNAWLFPLLALRALGHSDQGRRASFRSLIDCFLVMLLWNPIWGRFFTGAGCVKSFFPKIGWLN